MSALLPSHSDVENDIYTEIIKPFIIESIDILASVLKNTDISGRTHFIDMVYHDSNRRIEFALKLATLVMHEVSKISLPDAGAVAAHIVQLSPDLGIGTISTGQLLYASASHENKITTIDIDNVQYSNKENTSLGFQVGKYLAYNYITSWTCMLAVSSEYDMSSAFRVGGRESKNVINQLFFYDCIKSINIFSGISSVFDKIYKQAKLISTQI